MGFESTFSTFLKSGTKLKQYRNNIETIFGYTFFKGIFPKVYLVKV